MPNSPPLNTSTFTLRNFVPIHTPKRCSARNPYSRSFRSRKLKNRSAVQLSQATLRRFLRRRYMGEIYLHLISLLFTHLQWISRMKSLERTLRQRRRNARYFLVSSTSSSSLTVSTSLVIGTFLCDLLT